MSSDMFPEGFKQYMFDHLDKERAEAKRKVKMMSETCSECGNEVTIQIMKGTGLCGENCRKTRDGETPKPKSQVDAGITNIIRGQKGGVNLNGIR